MTAPQFELTQVKQPSTHDVLTHRAERWLRNRAGCKLVMREVKAMASEVPDAIGWKGDNETILVECKASRSDFRCDKLKPFRADTGQGMGLYRYFMCPPGLIKPEDCPRGWGLLYCHPGVVTLERGWNPHTWDATGQWRHPRNTEAEAAMLLSALGRVRRKMGGAWLSGTIHETYTPFGASPRKGGE